MTSVDTIYEFAGFSLAGEIQALLGRFGLPLLAALAGTAWLVHALASDRATLRDLTVHVLSIGVLVWLLSPVREGRTSTPRFLAWLGRAADLVQKGALRRIHERFLESPFEWERLAAMASYGHVADPALEASISEFLEACAKPALVRAAPTGANLLRAGALPYAGECESRRASLWQRVHDHLEGHPAHRAVLEIVRRRDPGQAEAFRERYLDQLVARAIDEPGSPTNEAALVAASVGEYAYVDPAQSAGRLPAWTASVISPAGAWAAETMLGAALSGAAALQQDWANRFSAKQRYFLVTAFGPHVYGLTLMILLGLFPLAGLFVLLPGRARVLAAFAKVYVSVKLWPVGWAALTRFNAQRGSLEALDPNPRGSGEAFYAVAGMYFLVPALAYLIVHLAAGAAALPFASAVPAPAGPGLGPAGPAAAAAARAAR